LHLSVCVKVRMPMCLHIRHSSVPPSSFSLAHRVPPIHLSTLLPVRVCLRLRVHVRVCLRACVRASMLAGLIGGKEGCVTACICARKRG